MLGISEENRDKRQKQKGNRNSCNKVEQRTKRSHESSAAMHLLPDDVYAIGANLQACFSSRRSASATVCRSDPSEFMRRSHALHSF